MNFLSNVLPGIRDLRAPFASGLLWLFALWLALGPALEGWGHARGLSHSMQQLKGVVQAVGWLAIIGFGAYLIGAIWTAFCSTLFRRWISRFGRDFYDWAEREVHDSLQRLQDAGNSLFEINIHVLTDALNALEYDRFGRRGAVDPLVAEARKRVEDERVGRWAPWEAGTYRAWQQVHLRLLGKEPALYAELDRYESEGEFRVAIAPPMLAVGIAVAARTGPWYTSLAVVIGAFLLAVLMFLAGITSYDQAKEAINLVVQDTRVRVPVLERLAVAVDEVTGKTTVRSEEPVPRPEPTPTST